MSRISVSIKSPAKAEACWALLEDFENISFFNPNLSASFLLEGSLAKGVGTMRQCNMKGGKNYIRERVTDWNEGRSYTIEIYEGSLPVNDAVTTLGLSPLPDGQTQLFMDFSYTPKYGLLGRVMDHLMLRRMMHGLLLKVLVGLSEKAQLATRQPVAV